MPVDDDQLDEEPCGDDDGLVHAGSVGTVCEVEVAWQEQDDEAMLGKIEDDGSFRDDPFALPADDHEG
jgi:hypothetical protein